MDPVPVDTNRVIEILQRDHPQILERAVMLARMEDLEKENATLKAALATPSADQPE